MDPIKKPRGGMKPETVIQNAIIKMLRGKGWYVKVTHGNKFQSGLPDLFCAHRDYGIRWVEVKNPKQYAFTPAQIDNFHAMAAVRVGIWILTADDEIEYKKLFAAPNWYTYLSEFRQGVYNK